MFLASSAELRPVLDHRGVQLELATLYQQMGADGRSALGRGGDQSEGVLIPGAVRLTSGEAAPQVDDGTAVHVDAARRADLAGGPFEVRPEDLGHLPPALLDMSPHHGPACRCQHAALPFLGGLKRIACAATLGVVLPLPGAGVLASAALRFFFSGALESLRQPLPLPGDPLPLRVVPDEG